MLWFYMLQGIVYGFSAAVQPGPFQTYLISQALSKGWKRTLPAALAPPVSDVPIIALCLLVLSQVPLLFQNFLDSAVGLFILYLAYGIYRSWRNFDLIVLKEDGQTEQSVLKAALTNALGPGPYIYWSLITGPILLAGWREAPIYGISFLVGFYVISILGYAALILMFSTAQKLGPRVNRTLLGVSAIALLCFGIYQLWLGVVGNTT